MAELTYLNLIKINQFPTQTEVVEGESWFIITGADGIGRKISEANLRLFLTTSTAGYMGGASPTTFPNEALGPQFYTATSTGTYTNFGGISVDNSEGITLLSYDGTSWVKSVVPINLAEYATSAELDVVSAQVADKIAISDLVSSSLIDGDYIVEDVLISGTGTVISPYVGARSIVDQPLSPNQTYSFGGVAALTGKNLCLTDASGNVRAGSVVALTTQPRIFTTDATYYFLRACLRHSSEVDDSGWINTAMLNEGVELGERGIYQIAGEQILDKTALKKSDGVARSSVKWDSDNWFNPDWIIEDKLVNNAGNIVSSSGWHMIKLDILTWVGETGIRVGNFSGSGSAYIGYYDESDTKISFGGVGLDPDMELKNFPTGTRYIYIDIKTPTDSVTKYENLIITKGSSTLSEYTPYAPYVTEIDGKKVSTAVGGGGEAYDQSLNTYDDVVFNSVTANSVEIPGTLKTGTLASPPVGIISGEFWADTTDSATNPILRVKI